MGKYDRKKDSKPTLIIAILALVTVIALGITIWALFFRDPVVLTPDYAPQQEDVNAETIPGDTEEKLEHSDGGGAVGLTYGTEVTIDLSDKAATLMFQNPGRSTADMVVQIVIQDTILAQSGKLEPGKMITTLDLLDGAAKQLQPGGYDGKFVILMYDPESGEKAMVNSEALVTINVVE